jgi:butyrate kinase
MFENFYCLWAETQRYDAAELKRLGSLGAQEDFRFNKIRELLNEKSERIGDINAFASTGGLLHPVEGGTYRISPKMLEDLRSRKYGENPANLGASLAIRFALAANTQYAYVVNPPVVDEMSEATRMTGFPGMRRRSCFHALNQKAVVLREAANLAKPIEECNFIVCHLGRTISVGAHERGKVADVNDINSGSGPMSLVQSGDLPPTTLVDLCFSGEFTKDEIKSRILSQGGLKGLLGTDDTSDIVRRVKAGERRAVLAFEAFMTQLAKQIGAAATVLRGKVDSVILTGELVNDEYLRSQIVDRAGWIAPLVAYPGDDELQALVEGVIRVIHGVEDAKDYA